MMELLTAVRLTPASTMMCSSMDTVSSSSKITRTPLAMDSLRSRWTKPSFLDRAAIPFTPKQLVATAPVMVVKTSLLIWISPLSF